MSAEAQEIARLRAWLKDIEFYAKKPPTPLNHGTILIAVKLALGHHDWPEVPIPDADMHHQRIAAIK